MRSQGVCLCEVIRRLCEVTGHLSEVTGRLSSDILCSVMPSIPTPVATNVESSFSFLRLKDIPLRTYTVLSFLCLCIYLAVPGLSRGTCVGSSPPAGDGNGLAMVVRSPHSWGPPGKPPRVTPPLRCAGHHSEHGVRVPFFPSDESQAWRPGGRADALILGGRTTHGPCGLSSPDVSVVSQTF